MASSFSSVKTMATIQSARPLVAVRAKALKNLNLRDSPLTDVSADSVMILGGGSVVSECSCQHLADSVMILGNSMVDLGGGWGVSE